MKAIFSLATVIALFALTPKNKLTGRWITKVSPKGNVTSVVFRADTTFDGFVNNKPFVNGTYSVDAYDVFSFVDNGCDGARGNYKLIFFSNNDSLRFEALNDPCEERKQGMSALIMGRVK